MVDDRQWMNLWLTTGFRYSPTLLSPIRTLLSSIGTVLSSIGTVLYSIDRVVCRRPIDIAAGIRRHVSLIPPRPDG